MPSSVSTAIQAEAARLIAQSRSPGSQLGTLLNDFLGRYLPSPYKVTSGQAIDSQQKVSPTFSSLIHTAPEHSTQIPADNLACVIDVHQKMGLEELRTSYEKIAAVKALEKSPRQKTKSGF